MKINKNYFIDGIYIKTNKFSQTLIMMYYDQFTDYLCHGIITSLNSKLENIYTGILKYINTELLSNSINNRNTTFICDFEKALINSINNIFYNTHLIGCYFHYKQILIRNAKKLGYGKNKFKDKIIEIINNKKGILPYIYELKI